MALFVFEFHTNMPGTRQCGNKMNSRINFNEKQSSDYSSETSITLF